jgi:SLT domain-containing protein
LRSGRINASTVTPAQIERIVEGERRKWVIPEKKKRAASRRKSKKRARERDSSLKRAGNRKARESVCEAVKVTRGGEIEVDFRVLFEGGKNGKVPAAKRVNKRE